MKKIILLSLVLIFVNSVYSQIITVTERESGRPIELVTISSESPRAFASTNVEGQADISKFKNSNEIVFRMLGYKTETFSFKELAESDFNVQMTSSIVSMDQVVVSATRWNQTSIDVPAKISTISAKDVTLQNPQTAADLLGSSGEVFIQKSQQGGGSPMIRGFSTNRLLYSVDGVRMNTAIFRSGNLQNVISLDPFAIENTEVYFGPGSVIYGSDAIGGVMNFKTLTPQLTLSGETFISGKAVTRYSSANNEKTVHFDVNVGWKNWAFLTSITHSDYGDLIMGRHGPDEYLRLNYVKRIDSTDVVVTNENPREQVPSGYSQINLMQKIRFKPGEYWDFNYGFHYSTTGDYPRYDRLIRYRNGLPRSAEWNYGPQVWMMNDFNITSNYDNFLYDQMSFRLAHQHFEESRIDRGFNSNTRSSRLEKVTALSANVDFNRTIGNKSWLFYGFELVYNDVTSTGEDENIASGIVSVGPSRYPQSTWSSYAAYLTYEYHLNSKFMIQSGLRYNQFILEADFSNNLQFYPFPNSDASINNGALTGSLGFVYHPSRDWSISSNASTGFRSPNVDDVGKVFDSQPGAVVVPNPDLKAEYAYNIDLSISKVFNDVVRFDITGFYTRLNDAMVRRDYSINGRDSIIYDGELSKVQAIQNAAKANVYGVQAGLEVEFANGFGFSSKFNYQKGEEELDDGSTSPSRHAPPWFGITRLTYMVDGLTMQINAIYNGEKSFADLPEEEKGKDYIYAMDENGNPYSPSWYTLNFKTSYQLNEIFTVNAGVENLTDQRYRPYSSGIVAPGRNFILSFKAKI